MGLFSTRGAIYKCDLGPFVSFVTQQACITLIDVLHIPLMDRQVHNLKSYTVQRYT